MEQASIASASNANAHELVLQLRTRLGIRCEHDRPCWTEAARKYGRVNTSAVPVYADRATGQSFETGREMVDDYLRRFAQRSNAPIEPLDEQGHTDIRRGSATLGVSVVEDHGVLLLVSKIMAAPKSDREGFFQRLLELSFLRTSDAAFALDGDDVYVRALRRLSGLDYEEFEDLVDTVATVADEYDDTLRQEFKGG